MKFIRFFEVGFNRDRIYGLDILRALAIILVVIVHGCLIFSMKNDQLLFLRDALDGVSLFFVLSGFLIGGILIRILEKEGATFRSLLNFWVRRWCRTLPAYLFILIALLILSFLFKINFGRADIYKYFLFLQNFNNSPSSFFPEAWSLSIEEWFYLLIPLIFFLTIRILKFSINKAILITIFLIIILTVTIRYYKYSLIFMPIDFSKWDLLLRDQVITRLDSLMFGVLAAYGSYYYKPFLDKNKLVLFLMGILILSIQLTGDLLGLFNFGLYQCVFSFVVIAIGGMFLIPLLSELKTGDGLVYRTVTYISRISYSMYLLHNTFIRGFLLKHINYNSLSRILLLKPVLIKYFLYWIFTIIGAHILFIGIEKPFMDLRKKIRI